MRRLAPLLVVLWAFPVLAQTLVLGPNACAALVEHVPDPGVAYTPGLDANGFSVAPADLPSIGVSRFDEVALQLTVDLRKRLGINLDRTLFPEGAELGYVTVREGKAYFNGEPLAPDADAALASLCRGRGLRWDKAPKR
jgi:hypothetical protein